MDFPLQSDMKTPHSKDWGVVFILWGVFVSSQLLLLGNARDVFPADGSNEEIGKDFSLKMDGSSGGIDRVEKQPANTGAQDPSSMKSALLCSVAREVQRTPQGVLYEPFNAIQGIVNVWKPSVQAPSNSASGIMACVGLECIAIGWKVDPQQYGDTRPHVFALMRNQTHTCYDTACPGVFESAEHIGLALETSVAGGSQKEANFVLLKDGRGVWDATVRLNNEERCLSIGQWPATALPALNHGATKVYWGGIVTTGGEAGAGTLPEMGSGRIPVGKKDGNYYGKVAYVRGMKVSVVPDHNLNEPPTDTLQPRITAPYGLQQVEKIQERRFYQSKKKGSLRGFFFGGPNQSS